MASSSARLFGFTALSLVFAGAASSVLPACGDSNSSAGYSGTPTTQIVPYEAGVGSGSGSDLDAGAEVNGHDVPPTSYDGSVGSTTNAPPPPSCDGKSGGSGKLDLAIVSGGKMRTAHLYVPTTYDRTKGAMLLLNFHGFTMEGDTMEAYANIDANAEKHGYIVVYPDGIDGSWSAGDCCGVAWTGGVDDVQFARDIVARIEENWCVDTHRVHSSGYSNGGFLSYELGCRASDIFASFYSVGGVLGIPPNECAPTRPVAMLEIHGTADPVVHWNGGTPVSPWDLGGPITFRSVATSIAAYRTLNDCLSPGTGVYANGDVSCTDYGSCAQNADVVLCTVDGGGHTWPETGTPDASASWIGPVTFDIDANEIGYEFLYAHPLP